MLTKIFGIGMGAMFVGMVVMYGLWTWQVNSLKGQVTALQNAKLELEARAKSQEATIKFLEKQKKIVRRVVREKGEISEVVNSGDLTRIRGLYDKYRLQPEGSVPHPAPGGKSSPKNKSAPKTGAGSVYRGGAG